MKLYNERVGGLSFSGLYEVFAKSLRLEAQGREMIHMEIGRPDYDSPEYAKAAVKAALDRGEVHYTDISGLAELRSTICSHEERKNNLKYDPDTEICIGAGASEVEAAILAAILDFGDEVLVPGPYFSAYYDQAAIAGATLVEVPVRMCGGEWELDLEELRGSITDKTRMIFVNTPNNPTGYVLSREKLEGIAAIAKEFDLVVVTDECYEAFVYEGESLSIAQLPDMKERTLVVKSTSKTYSMTGWRVGYVMGPAAMIKYINKVHQNFSVCCNSFAQWGVIEALEQGEAFIKRMVDAFRKNRDCACEILSGIEGVKLAKPHGAFYLFPDLSRFGLDDSAMCDYLMEKAGVVSVPGVTFGTSGVGCVRLSYCQSFESVRQGCEKIKKALLEL